MLAIAVVEVHFLTSPHSGQTTVTTTSRVTLQSGQVEETYVTSSPPNSSQWLIVKSSGLPISISANNTGLIPESSSLEALNQTKIGVDCVSVGNSGACLSFKQYLETGWFWNNSDLILYVHYVGGPAVKISVVADKGG